MIKIALKVKSSGLFLFKFFIIMKAIIKYSWPPAGQLFYDLPLFESHPEKHWTSLAWESVLCTYSNGELPKWYWLSFEPDNYNIFSFSTFDEDGKGLTENQIRKINELYFYMLDHPDLVEGEVNL